MSDKANKNIFVLYSPGTAGTHVANMLATDAGCVSRATSYDYKNHHGKHAHIENLKNLTNIVGKSADHPEFGNVFCGHFASYYWEFYNGEIQHFKNQQIILIEPPKDQNSIAFKRYTKFNKIATNEYYYSEQRLLYTVDIIQKVFGQTDFFILPAEMIFDQPLENFLQYATDEMNFDLDKHECKLMHNSWTPKIVEYINQ